MPEVSRTCTLNRSLRGSDVSEVLSKSLEENTLMRQRNYKVIVKCKLLGTSKIGTLFNDYRHPILKNDILRQEYFSINITTGLYYELCLKILMQYSCKRFILLFKFSI